MDSSWVSSCRAFADAAEWFVSTAALVDDRWTLPGLGEWDVRSLVGHTSRSLLTVETYLSCPAEFISVESAAEYFKVTKAIATNQPVAARGRDAREDLGMDPAAAVADIAARVVPVVVACEGAELITTIAGGMRLRDYLPTRTFELVVHTADLRMALDMPADAPGTAAARALELVAQLAVAGGLAGPLLLAATGRQGLPASFSVS
ncbi:MAG: maleylpyruvate isomerase N-terminal domain-containing protein [Nocardioides sp.]|uniref:maleylpyruvate isomerase N-terminal domain-containing protein n=1 Tax=Nocardioides sp. TaxID=35761 RepID=UPI0032678FF4